MCTFYRLHVKNNANKINVNIENITKEIPLGNHHPRLWSDLTVTDESITIKHATAGLLSNALYNRL